MTFRKSARTQRGDGHYSEIPQNCKAERDIIRRALCGKDSDGPRSFTSLMSAIVLISNLSEECQNSIKDFTKEELADVFKDVC